MADRVHPRDSPPAGERATAPSHDHPETPAKPAPPSPEKPVPSPGTYVIQVPKDQIYRHPPPENARRYDSYARRKSRGSCCCRCLCWTLALFATLVILAAIAAGVLYLVFRPKSPKYSVDNVTITGFNLSSSTASPSISPEIDVTVRAENPNDKISIYYEDGSSVDVYYSDVNLCNGVLPTFHQPSNNVTVFKTPLKGSGVVLTTAVQTALVTGQEQGKVPLNLKLKAPVKIKVGAVKTWKITVKVSCDITVDKLTADSKLVSKDCDVSVKLW